MGQEGSPRGQSRIWSGRPDSNSRPAAWEADARTRVLLPASSQNPSAAILLPLGDLKPVFGHLPKAMPSTCVVACIRRCRGVKPSDALFARSKNRVGVGLAREQAEGMPRGIKHNAKVCSPLILRVPKGQLHALPAGMAERWGHRFPAYPPTGSSKSELSSHQSEHSP